MFNSIAMHEPSSGAEACIGTVLSSADDASSLSPGGEIDGISRRFGMTLGQHGANEAGRF
jgi:hypothetical protein